MTKMSYEVFKVKENPFRNSELTRCALDPSHVKNNVAVLAEKLVQEWGKVPFDADGYDKRGRQKAKRLKPKQIVKDAFEASEEFYRIAFERGHMLEMPSVREENEVKDEHDV